MPRLSIQRDLYYLLARPKRDESREGETTSLTPALSPGRGRTVSRAAVTPDPADNRALATQPPSPGGEGKGEGERTHHTRPRPISAHLLSLGLFAWLALSPSLASAEPRFPPPDFESGHQVPITATPAPRFPELQYLDTAVLAGALGVAAWLVYRRRSRRGLLALSIFSVLYFGFWRRGCVCAIGSPQNLALALGDPTYAVPLTVLAYFFLPLVFALVVGRVFCAGVCPHGTLQDLVLIKPMRLPPWLEQGLGVIPFIYLGAGILFAATGSSFLFCQYDPFVPIFRLSGRTLMVLSGAVFLALGLFVGRPYCRFLCPYGALLKLTSSLARWRVRVTPTYCTQCRLCEYACPFGAIREPEASTSEPGTLAVDRRRLGWLIVLLPMLVAAGAGLGWAFRDTAARLHPEVALAERLAAQPEPVQATGPKSVEQLALDRAQQSPRETLTAARLIQNKFAWGTPLFGAWIGLVIGGKLTSLALRRRRTDYEPDAGSCFACARCFTSCPNELLRRGLTPAPLAASPTPGSAPTTNSRHD